MRTIVRISPHPRNSGRNQTKVFKNRDNLHALDRQQQKKNNFHLV